MTTHRDIVEDWLLVAACVAVVAMWVLDLFSVPTQNAVIFGIAFIINVYAMRTHGLPAFKAIRAAVAFLAIVFLVSYVYLARLHDPHDIARWGEINRGISRISVPVIWWTQAIAVIQFGRLNRRVIEVGTDE